jgi:alpha-L-fucosidase
MNIVRFQTAFQKIAMIKSVFSSRCTASTISLSLVLITNVALAQTMPPFVPIPDLPPPKPPGTVQPGDPKDFPEVKLDFPIADGPYQPTWDSIAQNYPGKEVAWLREAKFGIWVHFGPQAAGQSGDWYARRMYLQGQLAYNNHLRDFGHPSEVGYKDLLRDWNPTKLDPAALVQTYQDAGARFLLIQGVHHDNFDNWNSTYQPWNSVNMGPKRDILGEWSAATHKAGMRFGVSFHHEYSWWWFQRSKDSDVTGNKAGVPYDGNLTLADGKGKWWEGYDPRLLYGVDLREYKGWDLAPNDWDPGHGHGGGILINHLDYCHWYATQWALRMMDVINKYDPDFIYTDGDSKQPFDGYASSYGYKCDAMQRVIADFYNHALQKRGKVDTFSVVKFHPPGNGVVTTFEGNWPKDIKTDQPWIGEWAYGDWYYRPGFRYDASELINHVLECISRDGSACVNIAMLPDGSLDEGSRVMLKDVGDWMRVNGDGVYGSHSWVEYGEKSKGDAGFTAIDFRFTLGKDGSLYAFGMSVPPGGTQIKIASLGSDAKKLTSSIKSVSLLGSSDQIGWKQDADGLVITFPNELPLKISSVFKITCDQPLTVVEAASTVLPPGYRPVLSPNDEVHGVKTTTKGNPTVYSQNGDYGGPSGTDEPPANATDGDPGTKYYNHVQDGSNAPGVNSGLVITPKVGASVVTAVQFTTADDTPDRDPMTFTLEGSNDDHAASEGAANFSLIYEGTTRLDSDPDRGSVGEVVKFTNTIAYKTYRILITNTRSKSTNAVQYGEVQLFDSAATPLPK